jgi:L-ascorbate metabolism protein UlaG (beta-lactamase superfamily)
MKKIFFTTFLLASATLSGQEVFESDVFKTSEGDLKITMIGHGTLMMQWNDRVIHIDPVSREADYTQLPDADLILVTHQHGDHLDAKAIAEIHKKSTKLIMTPVCLAQLKPDASMGVLVMKNGDRTEFDGINISAIPAYNIVHKRENGVAYHPQGEGNGYVLNFGGKNILIAGDTENIPEIKALKNIEVAFLPMNLPYTMTPEMVADAAKAFKPKVLYPYHFGNTDTGKLVELLKDSPDTEVRIRKF